MATYLDYGKNLSFNEIFEFASDRDIARMVYKTFVGHMDEGNVFQVDSLEAPKMDNHWLNLFQQVLDK